MKHALNIKNTSSFLLLTLLIALCYSNSLNNSWQLDDYQNILQNPAIHLEHLQPSALIKTFFAEPSFNDTLYRPIACFTFALNWYFGQDSPFGYHLVNIIVHILTAFFLYKTTVLLLQSPKLQKRSPEAIFFISLFGAALWAISPIQTQAVTYIVQRMASMSAMFFMLALFQYSYTRLVVAGTVQRLFHLFLCGLFFLLALGCKENAITFIPTLLLVELTLLNRDDRFAKNVFFLVVAANVLVLLAAGYFTYSQGYLTNLTTPYKDRPFSIAERLLTQPSVLLFYLTLLLYPNPTRLSIDHNFTSSTSLFAPWTTVPAILCIILLVWLGYSLRKKTPLVSFALFFYLINHLVESTIIPLEMVFEHRNYLPSMFLFMLLTGGLWQFLQLYSSRSRLIHTTVLLLIPMLLVATGLGTYSRNLVWASEESLWADALQKGADNARAWAKLGIIYGWQKEQTPENLRKATAFMRKATELDFPNVNFKAMAVDNIGKLYAMYGLYDEAIGYYHQALAINKDFTKARIDLADALQKSGKLEKALQEINIILSHNSINPRFYLVQSTVLLWLNKPLEAAEASRKYMMSTSLPHHTTGYYSLGVALTKAGYHERGQWFLTLAHQEQPTDIRILLSLLENSVRAQHQDKSKLLAQQLVAKNTAQTLTDTLQALRTDYSSLPVDSELITPFIMLAAQEFFPPQASH
ncbi:tetratricopeptide repeat protein [Desulfobulbus oligotrophicus]|uniref:Tetratricopeptide repeat protein n=1 Tax=Desulfobulbus oligotrophicus TaxID=1909699 RepID=A0A7T5VDI8_9BACT|nr:tetratricopeptide repeat protein [Desulfobulbus oligotrophicus]QQG65907.1 tetratricopeptide repeat protein [Desulfobulbus oligotrophicus]